MELYAPEGNPPGFLTGRWCSLFVRGVRQGCFRYEEWGGTRGELLKERLIMDDIENDILMTLFGGLGADARKAIISIVLPWMSETRESSEEIDYDAMYSATIKAVTDVPRTI